MNWYRHRGERSSAGEQPHALTAQFELAGGLAAAFQGPIVPAVRRQRPQASGAKQLARAAAREPEDSLAEF
jgi:hypothetical protein